MGTMNNITSLTKHFAFSYVHSGRVLGQSKDTTCVFETLVGILGSGVEFVKRMQVRRDIGNLLIMFDHIKHVKNQTTMACHVYASKYVKC